MFEWIMALALAGLGTQLMLWPGSLLHSRFSTVTYLMTSETLMMVCMCTVFSRLLILFKNGALKQFGGPLRGASAFIGGLVWLQMVIALMNTGPVPSPTIPVYLALVIGEMISVFRAGRDSTVGENGRIP